MSLDLLFDFTGKTVLVTGAAKGIGRRIALDFAIHGAKMVGTDIDEDGLILLANELSEINSPFLTDRCDVTVSAQVASTIQRAAKHFGTIDILVNNAGLLTPGIIEETTDELIDQTLNVNLKGVLYAIREITPIMKQKKFGRIINVASITGKNGDNSTIFAYGAAKGGVISLTRSVARQLGPFGITCNAIAPHAVMTKMMAHWDDEKKASIALQIPVRRLGSEQDMADLVLFLASDRSSFINGETVNINGGYYMD